MVNNISIGGVSNNKTPETSEDLKSFIARQRKSVGTVFEGSDRLISDSQRTASGDGYIYIVNNHGNFEIHQTSIEGMSAYRRALADLDQHGKSKSSEIALREIRHSQLLEKAEIPHVEVNSSGEDFSSRNDNYQQLLIRMKELAQNN